MTLILGQVCHKQRLISGEPLVSYLSRTSMLYTIIVFTNTNLQLLQNDYVCSFSKKERRSMEIFFLNLIQITCLITIMASPD